MANQAVKKATLQNTIEEAQAQLEQVEFSQFSPKALSVLKKRTKDFRGQLRSEAIKSSKRHQSDIVSAADVKWATEYLTGRSSGFLKHIGKVGGILLGVSLTTAKEMILSGQYSGVGLLVSLICGVVGTYLVARE